MPTKFYRLMATDASPFFEPISEWMGIWSGVARVEDEAEVIRLNKRGCTEISEEAYDNELKKKAQQRSGLGDFRQVMEVVRGPLPAQPVAQKAPEPEVVAPTMTELATATEVPAISIPAESVPSPGRKKSAASTAAATA